MYYNRAFLSCKLQGRAAELSRMRALRFQEPNGDTAHPMNEVHELTCCGQKEKC
jgi:hypothetical protein